jgi:hypothetical protein
MLFYPDMPMTHAVIAVTSLVPVASSRVKTPLVPRRDPTWPFCVRSDRRSNDSQFSTFNCRLLFRLGMIPGSSFRRCGRSARPRRYVQTCTHNRRNLHPWSVPSVTNRSARHSVVHQYWYSLEKNEQPTDRIVCCYYSAIVTNNNQYAQPGCGFRFTISSKPISLQ